MAENVLGVLFQDIADAIRSKTGDTATMKPAEFPSKIEAIETGGGGSGGGGSEGLTLTCAEWFSNTKYYHKFAQLNGTLYEFRYTYNGFGNSGEVYSYDSERTTRTLVTTFSNYGLGASIELGGLLHLFYDKKHQTFDGSTFATLNDTPVSGGTFEYNGTLMRSTESKVIYAWDESTDTWSVFANSNAGLPRGLMTFHEYNGDLYAFYSRDGLYKWNGSAFEKMCDGANVGQLSCKGYGKHIYYILEGTAPARTKLHRINIETCEYEYVGALPSREDSYNLCTIDGKFVYHIMNNTYGGKVFYVNV